jgi:hypothetical protein
MTNLTYLITSSLLCLGMSASACGQAPPAKPKKPVASVVGDPGEQAFKANCSRCHNPPETLNPRITGTVIRHMRVRANLSAADEREILKYLNP